MQLNFFYKFILSVWLLASIDYDVILIDSGSFNPINKSTKRQLITSATVIKGVVLDEETKLPVGFANITLIKNQKGTQTGSKGEFELQITSDHQHEKISITSLGYIFKVVEVEDLLKEWVGTKQIKIYLKPKYEDLREVEIKAKSKKWRARKVGFNLDKGTSFHHKFNPLDTLVEKSGREIGNKFSLKKYPAYLNSISFGLAGSGNVKSIIGLRIYSLKNNLPDKDILPERIILRVPPHHTGWVTVDLDKYNIMLKDDFAVTVEWLSQTNILNKSSLMAFATHPKGQVTYARVLYKNPWSIVRPTLTNVNSIGLYVIVLY
ncbi:hypothetical protein ABID22_002613 [Pontibacter aydingkolensis]|uniref:Carboxypeptidase-like regulatory domain-containing protein n=1 Tax=Pontibacter aydingkolensis TaxID=1911536 RepID=A0ABS7CWZ6_9BACT|nr:carboxypeptidase-like regulatory domain-containing protein [Pontibacter aydingkolensis]MBW7468211.1 carboxypeptidase-like regulatory domain-containing protein [Pontibacter aydingkolensis]